jgi:hypothetical protein
MKSLAMFVYIDALDPRLLNRGSMPLMSNLVKTSHYHGGTIENVLGYSFAIQSSMFSGKNPDESGYWLPYYYAPNNAPPLLKAMANIGELSSLDRMSRLRFVLTNSLRRLSGNRVPMTHNIPFSIMDNFSFFPYYYVGELPSFNELSALVYKKYGVLLTYFGPPKVRHDDLYDTLLARAFQTDIPQMMFIYEDRLDSVAHSAGPSSHEYKTVARHIDNKLGQLHRTVAKLVKDPIMIFFSDHSQSDLLGTIDIVSDLGKVGLRLGKDYICFIDATIFLVWSRSEANKEKITRFLQATELGALIDDRLRKEYHLCFKNEKLYGDIIYVLKPGWTFFPNYFSPFSPMKGLHGYLPEEKVQKAFVKMDSRITSYPRHVTDLKDTILKCCELMRQD